MRRSTKHCVVNLEKNDGGVSSIFEMLPVGTIQEPGTSVEFLRTTANEPGANTLERGRRSVRAEKMTIVGLNKNA